MLDEMIELRKDFKSALSKIDFTAYDPYSRPFMNALFIGQMFMCMQALECGDDVEEELDGARKYYAMFQETGDSTYKDMAGDELRHAGILIKKHLAKTTDESHREALNIHEKERQDMLKAMSVKEV